MSTLCFQFGKKSHMSHVVEKKNIVFSLEIKHNNPCIAHNERFVQVTALGPMQDFASVEFEEIWPAGDDAWQSVNGFCKPQNVRAVNPSSYKVALSFACIFNMVEKSIPRGSLCWNINSKGRGELNHQLFAPEEPTLASQHKLAGLPPTAPKSKTT